MLAHAILIMLGLIPLLYLAVTVSVRPLAR